MSDLREFEALLNAQLSATENFGFQFPNGFRWAKDMSREDLLYIIKVMRRQHESDRKDVLDAMVKAKWLVLV